MLKACTLSTEMCWGEQREGNGAVLGTEDAVGAQLSR